jgi:hypothetical protein
MTFDDFKTSFCFVFGGDMIDDFSFEFDTVYEFYFSIAVLLLFFSSLSFFIGLSDDFSCTIF